MAQRTARQAEAFFACNQKGTTNSSSKAASNQA
jgi:hypothetical protein